MKNEKRTIVTQITMFTLFFFIGFSYVLDQLLTPTKVYDIIKLSFFGVILVGGLIWFFLTAREQFIEVDNNFLTQTKAVFYSIAVGLVIGIISSFFKEGSFAQLFLLIFSGTALSLISLYGLYISVKALIKKD